MKLLSTKEAAKLITTLTGKPISARQVANEIKMGNLQGQKFGHSYVVSEDAIKNYKRRPTGVVPKKPKPSE